MSKRTIRSGRCLLLSAALLLCSAAAAAAQSQPAKVEWTATDVQNKEVKVPAAGKTSVLVFVRPDQPQSRHAVEDVRKLVATGAGLQVVGIVSGEMAEREAPKFAQEGGWPFPVVADPKYAASGKLGVRVWPTTLVILPDGRQVAHIGGYPTSFAKDLGTYLEFAAGKFDQAELEKRLGAREVVADTADQKAGRHLQVARALLERGLPDQAKAEIAKALEFHPTDPTLQIAIARLLLATGSAKQADEVVGKIDAARVPPAQINLIKGRVALAMERWDEAGKLLADAAKLNPDPAEAYYYLGLVYEHQQDHAKAAEAFRQAFEATPAGKALAPAGK